LILSFFDSLILSFFDAFEAIEPFSGRRQQLLREERRADAGLCLDTRAPRRHNCVWRLRRIAGVGGIAAKRHANADGVPEPFTSRRHEAGIETE